jgi:hypothetical protein
MLSHYLLSIFHVYTFKKSENWTNALLTFAGNQAAGDPVPLVAGPTHALALTCAPTEPEFLNF